MKKIKFGVGLIISGIIFCFISAGIAIWYISSKVTKKKCMKEKNEHDNNIPETDITEPF